MKTFHLLLIALPFIAACSPSNNSPAPEPQRPQYLGDLDQKANEIYSSENEDSFYPCDRTWKPKVLEISAALEKNRVNIVTMEKNRTLNGNPPTILKFGNYDFLESNEKIESDDIWVTDRYSWKDAAEIYDQIKTDLFNKNWRILNSIARSLILEDNDRIVDLSHPGVRRLSEPVIKSTFAAIEKCYKDEPCTVINFNDSQKSWLDEGRYHNFILNRMSSPSANDTTEVKRRRVKFLFNDIGWAAHRFEFTVNDSVAIENGELIVPLNLDILDQGAADLILKIEKTWRQENLPIRVVNRSNGYKVQISETPGERAFVSRKDKIMQLYAPTRLTTVYHEFGHVIGLPDSYYTSFDQNSCEYIDESNESDIMSNGVTGRVLPSLVEKILQAYGIN